MKKYCMLIAACSIMFVACTSKAGEQQISTDHVMTKSYKYGWNVSIVINNPGTKSQGRTFSLYYKKNLIPYVFEIIYAGGQMFRFKQRVNLWNSAGYVPVDESSITAIKDSITQVELHQGWYDGSNWKQGTPDHWCTVTRDGISAVINPERLNDFLAQYSWKPFSLYYVELVPENP